MKYENTLRAVVLASTLTACVGAEMTNSPEPSGQEAAVVETIPIPGSPGITDATIVVDSFVEVEEVEEIEAVPATTIVDFSHDSTGLDQSEQLTPYEEAEMIRRMTAENRTNIAAVPDPIVSETNSDTTAAPDSTDSLAEIVEQIVPREQLFEGNKVADIIVTNIDGQIMVDTPLFVTVNMRNASAMNTQLYRGAVLFVAHPDVNPDIIDETTGIPQMGLPGEVGQPTNVFGHNASFILKDRDGNSETEDSTTKERVFYLLDEAEIGATLTVQLTEAAGGKLLSYELAEESLIENVQPGGEGTGMSYEKALELYKPNENPSLFQDDQSTMRFIKCSPDGSVRDRQVSTFVLTSII